MLLLSSGHTRDSSTLELREAPLAAVAERLKAQRILYPFLSHHFKLKEISQRNQTKRGQRSVINSGTFITTITEKLSS